MEISARINQANGRLKSARVGARIERKGNRLILRGTLPPKPDSNRSAPYQQKIYLGIPANPDGVRRAEKEARKVGALLATKEFSWEAYQRETRVESQTACEVIERFKTHYLGKGGNETTWNGDYWKVLKKIPENVKIDIQTLERLITATAPNTKTRQRACMVATAIARFLSLDADFSAHRGNYKPGTKELRDIPSDELIARSYSNISNPAWRWVYGMMATYGLRNHEVFHLDLTDLPIIRVLETTKTGSREVWPCYPEWVELFGLKSSHLPDVDLERSNEALGHSVTRYLSPKLPFKPYDLRHAWAIRTSVFGWPVELAARQMGHSVEMHTQTYHRWINREHQQKVYDLLVNRSDRPRSPSISDT
jgi:integrase